MSLFLVFFFFFFSFKARRDVVYFGCTSRTQCTPLWMPAL